jgi:hypothetical protein
MAEEVIQSPDGEILRLIAKVRSTPHADNSIKLIETDSTTVEIILSDGRIASRGSQWGHVAMDINGIVYGMSHNGYDQRPKDIYLSSNAFRDSIGVVLRVSPAEREKMRLEFERRKSMDRGYNLVSNSCSTNVADVLESIGILAHDPRFFFAPASTAGVAPKELLIAIKRSKRVVRIIDYPKK